MSLAWELVGEINVASQTTQVNFAGLNFTSDDNLMLVSDIRNGASDTNFYLYVNGLTSTYYNQKLTADSSAVSGARATTAIMSYCEANDDTLCNAKIKLTESGYFTWHADNTREYDTTTVALDNFYGTKAETVASIEQINIVASDANAINIGSRFQLYKCIGEVVADITVSTATTLVDISGLSIGTDNEYMLVTDINNTTSESNYTLSVNDNTTLSNYYRQTLFANGSTIGASRYNDNSPIYIPGNLKALANLQLKLTENGYFTWQCNEIRSYGTSYILLSENYGSSSFTLSSITKLTINSLTTNAIGAGSRFQLIRMK